MNDNLTIDVSDNGKVTWFNIHDVSLIKLLQGKYTVTLPDDAKILSTRSNHMFGTTSFLIQSSEFLRLKVGDPIPNESLIVSKKGT